jgi:hypothetical protein
LLALELQVLGVGTIFGMRPGRLAQQAWNARWGQGGRPKGIMPKSLASRVVKLESSRVFLEQGNKNHMI